MSIKEQAIRTLELESAAIKGLIPRINQDFEKACKIIMKAQENKGRTIVIGMGKSGHIGHKIAATLASTGTPSFFVHPAEAGHGDLGMITESDVVLAISNSGETTEIALILPVLKRQAIPIIAMVGNKNSILAKQADVILDISVEKEACPLNLAPTSSTTATLALGDALAVAILDANNFKPEDFARSHPGGKLGRKLLTYITDVMRTAADIPRSRKEDTILDVIVTISKFGMGFTVIVDNNKVLGIFTDGDLRRLLNKNADKSIKFSDLKINDYMTKIPTLLSDGILADEALRIMEDKKISTAPVINSDKKLVGVISMHDLLNAGIA